MNIFQRLYGNTVEEQLAFLQKRIIILAICIVIDILLFVFSGTAGASLLCLYFVFGWPAFKSLFGLAGIGVIFSENVMIGVVIFVAYIIIGSLFGLIVGLLGIGRFIYLKVKMRGNAQ